MWRVGAGMNIAVGRLSAAALELNQAIWVVTFCKESVIIKKWRMMNGANGEW